MTHPTNEMLAEQLRSLRELIELRFDQGIEAHQRTNDHLTELNGKVAQNSVFRIRAMTFYAIAVFLVPIAISIVLNKML